MLWNLYPRVHIFSFMWWIVLNLFGCNPIYTIWREKNLNDVSFHIFKRIWRLVSYFPTIGFQSTSFRPKDRKTFNLTDFVKFKSFGRTKIFSAEKYFRPKTKNWHWWPKPEKCPKHRQTSEVADSYKHWEFAFGNDTSIFKIESTFNSYNLFSFSLFLSNFL